MPQVKSGAVAKIVGESPVSSVSPPTALSLWWGLPRPHPSCLVAGSGILSG
jgi:hypothetical protein